MHAPFDAGADGRGTGTMAASPAGEMTDSPFADEVVAMQWILDQVREDRPLGVIEAEAVVATLYVEQRAGGRVEVPLVPVLDVSRYDATHAINVTFLAMAIADELQFDNESIRRVGLAALLHDIGMTRVPGDLVAKAGQISPEERELVKMHPTEGARILMGASPTLDLAAVVAYEHHLRTDGGGYPRLLYPRTPHYVSRLVQVCDVYDALSSARPYRAAWPVEIIISYLSERAGFEFHPALAAALTALVQRGAITAR